MQLTRAVHVWKQCWYFSFFVSFCDFCRTEKKSYRSFVLFFSHWFPVVTEAPPFIKNMLTPNKTTHPLQRCLLCFYFILFDLFLSLSPALSLCHFHALAAECGAGLLSSLRGMCDFSCCGYRMWNISLSSWDPLLIKSSLWKLLGGGVEAGGWVGGHLWAICGSDP